MAFDYQTAQVRQAHGGTSGRFWDAVAREEYLRAILQAERSNSSRNISVLVQASYEAEDEAPEMRQAALKFARRVEAARRTLLRVQSGEVSPGDVREEYERQWRDGDFADVKAELARLHGKHPEMAIPKGELRPPKPVRRERPEVPYPASKAPKSIWAKLFGK